MTAQRRQRTSFMSRAEQLQRPDVTAQDRRLTRIAQSYQPGVRWWWGHRKIDGINGIYCYLCGRPIVQHTGADRLSERARLHVIVHRGDELRWQGIITGNDAGGTLPPAGASPSGEVE